MRSRKRLFLLEYTAIGPLISGEFFIAVGFEIKHRQWGFGFLEEDSDFLFKEILPEVVNWQPDVIVFFLAPGFYAPSLAREPQDWLAACQFIRQHQDLQHTKITAFLGAYEGTLEQENSWAERYNFFVQGPVRVIEHVKAIKKLVGETVKGFEGVNYHLLNMEDDWKVQPYLLEEQGKKNSLQPDAEGLFSGPLAEKTRLLMTSELEGYAWGECIKTETPTYIVYVLKKLEIWQKEGLSITEIERLSILADGVPAAYQLLVGVNDVLLKAETELIVQVLEQAQQSGGWQIFINEHLRFEGFCPWEDFEEIVYQGVEVDPQRLPITM